MAKHSGYRMGVNAPHRASNRIYLTPLTGSFAVGSSLTIEVRENSGSTGVTAAEGDFTYPTDLLQYVSMDFTNSSFPYQPPSGNGASNGTVTMQSSGPTLTGDQLVGTVTFTVLAAGTADLVFAGSSQLLDGNGNNVLTITNGATYTFA